MNIRACIVTFEYPPTVGGVAVSAHRVAKLLTRSGYSMHVAVPEYVPADTELPGRGLRIATALEDDVWVHRICIPQRTRSWKDRDIEVDFYVALSQLHNAYSFQLLHSFYLRTPVRACTFFAAERNLPYIVSARGGDLYRQVFAPGGIADATWILQHATWSTYVSEDLRRRALTLAPSVRDRSTVFWNSIDANDLSDLPDVASPGSPDVLRIGTIGRIRHKKGWETLIEACKHLEKRFDFTLILIGDYVDAERDYWNGVVSSSGLSERVIRLGLMDRRHALAHLRTLDVVVFPSYHDGCPNGLLEAMASARPIVASRVDALGEVLEHDRTALLVEALNDEALAEALARVLADPTLRARLGQAAREDVLVRFRPDLEQASWNSVYENALHDG